MSRLPQRLGALALLAAALVPLAACTSDSGPPASSTPPTGAVTLAPTPPMGWNSWNHFGCSITQADVEAAARTIAQGPLAADGYRSINVDDCWQAAARDDAGRLTADPARFPDGMAALASYVHGLGLRFGLYATPGRYTCGELYNEYPGQLGSLGHEQTDARTFASWGVDYLKYDWCKADRDGVEREQAFTTMRRALTATGRPIVLSIHDVPERPIPSWRATTAQLWRTTRDIHDTWDSMIAIARLNAPLGRYARPGAWNDPDMLEVGNGGMTDTEYRTHFSLWAQMAAPLILGNDVTEADTSTAAIVGNRAVIAVDQDVRGVQAHVVTATHDSLVLVRPLAGGASAVTLTNLGSSTRTLSADARTLGLSSLVVSPHRSVRLTDLWSGSSRPWTGSLSVQLPAHGTAMFTIAAQ